MSVVEQSYTISGMHCAACSSRIERVVSGLGGVESASVNLAVEKAKIAFDTDQINSRQIREAIEGIGFGAEKASDGVDELETRREEAIRQLAMMKKRLLLLIGFAAVLFYLSMGEMIGLPLPPFLEPSNHPFIFGISQFMLVVPIMYLGKSFYIIGIPALFRRAPTMDSLIAIGTGAAFIYSVWGLIEIGMGVNVHERVMDLYFESAGILITLVYLGKYLEASSKLHTSGAISQLMQLTPDTATLLENDRQITIAVDEIADGDLLLIRPGERIPVDGMVKQGTTTIDESMLTGESIPVEKNDADNVYSGTLNQSGTIHVEATGTGENTVLAKIVRMVSEAQGSKAPIASLADRISLYFVPAVMVIALVTGMSWYVIGGVEFSLALRFFIAVLVIACPCAMGLATPTSIMVGTGRGAQLGVLVKNAEALQKAEQIKTIVFDKTGTLTRGKPEVASFKNLSSQFSDQELMTFAGSLEQASEHPLAKAIVDYAAGNNYSLRQADSFTLLPGAGVQGSVDGHDILIGSDKILARFGLELPADIDMQDFSRQGWTVVFVVVDSTCSALIAIADQLKSEAPEVVKTLRENKLNVVMLTGDHPDTARAIAEKAGISDVIARVLPDEKRDKIAAIQQTGQITAMVGDGINDAPALAQADVGIAMGGGTDIAMESGDIVLMRNDLNGVVTALSLSRAVMKNIRQNLFWAFAYNVTGIPIAAGVLYIFGGPALNPMLAGGAMALSSVSVVTNALRLRYFKG